MQWYLILAALITLIISIFAVQNSQQVTLKFIYWDLPSFPLVLVILFSTAVGVLITLLFSLTKQLRLTMKVHDLQSRLKQSEKKLSQSSTGAEQPQGSSPPPAGKS